MLSTTEQLFILSRELRTQTLRVSKKRLSRLDCGDKLMMKDSLERIIRELRYVNEVMSAGCSVLVDELNER